MAGTGGWQYGTTAMIDPDEFVITRKRKKYRFARFANATNCYELHEWTRQPVDVIEIGAGTGLSLVELAAHHPERQFLALDVKGDRLQKGAYAALEQGVTNISFVRARADQISELVPEHSVHEIWLTFSDPFPRQGSAGRRLTHPGFLHRYAAVLALGGSVIIKHDNPAFFAWSLEQLVTDEWHVTELSFDLHESALLDDYKILTSYEQRWLNEGRVTQFARAYITKEE